MAGGAALLFDRKTDAAIRGLWQVIEDAGLPSAMLTLNFPPHISVLTHEDSNLPGFRSALADFIRRTPPILLEFHALSVFNTADGVIYLTPTVTRPLLDFHAALWEIIAPHTSQPNPLYRPGLWVPHVTLDLDIAPEQVAPVIAALLRAGLPRSGLIESLVLADFLPDNASLQEMDKFRLGGAAA